MLDIDNINGSQNELESAIAQQTGGTGLDEAFQSDSGILLIGGVEETAQANYKWQNIGILFDYIKDETSSVEAEITDNWVETNFTYQDHIAIKPRIYRISGCVGEVIHENLYKALNTFDDFTSNHPVFQKTMNVVNGISALSSTVSDYTRAAMNVVKQVESKYDRYKQIYNNFTKANQIRGKRQAILYEKLVAMMQNRMPVKLTKLAFGEEISPDSYNYDKTFFIQSVSARQGDNAFISDIEVVIKEVRIATTQTTKVDTKNFAQPVAAEKTSTTVQGKAQGTVVPATAQEIKKFKELQKKGETTSDWKNYKPKNRISRFCWKIKQNNEQYNKSTQVKPYSKSFK